MAASFNILRLPDIAVSRHTAFDISVRRFTRLLPLLITAALSCSLPFEAPTLISPHSPSFLLSPPPPRFPLFRLTRHPLPPPYRNFFPSRLLSLPIHPPPSSPLHSPSFPLSSPPPLFPLFRLTPHLPRPPLPQLRPCSRLVSLPIHPSSPSSSLSPPTPFLPPPPITPHPLNPLLTTYPPLIPFGPPLNFHPPIPHWSPPIYSSFSSHLTAKLPGLAGGWLGCM
ncbi:unnamed protein product [Closterium sp. Naga37s-1]|nr:unnamed protein product [Closterium sp. Naga37s-1]